MGCLVPGAAPSSGQSFTGGINVRSVASLFANVAVPAGALGADALIVRRARSHLALRKNEC